MSSSAIEFLSVSRWKCNMATRDPKGYSYSYTYQNPETQTLTPNPPPTPKYSTQTHYLAHNRIPHHHEICLPINQPFADPGLASGKQCSAPVIREPASRDGWFRFRA
ncbi:uncharacterized protein BDCG_16055 [Blastomyces dermatitidis ER-3]|uniref:Uncharacterized protein n=1 Tax=Ajellomyces dermatitidis (strain ER-3 / ATCC MYA-2586) TaxID=559297 RepID=A0ABX2VPU3_AJEDR|nr:uncharacterized protein BDCG_16055 [Blastomyces dermatitidis ER-3]OAS99284.1 hypothetical protein BDCG_16055 [Blastomyces dermatitidis ER-3]